MSSLASPDADVSEDGSRIGAQGLRRGLHAFRYLGFRRLWIAAVLMAFANWMERLAVGWLVLEATDSVFLAAASFAASQVPNVILGPIAGAVVDRVERRKLMILTALVKAVIAVLLGLVVYADLVVAVWPIFLLVAVNGSMRTFEFPSTQALIVDIVGMRNVTNAVGLYSVGARSAGMVGAFAAGMLIEYVGSSLVFFLAALLLMIGAVILRTLRVDRRTGDGARRSVWVEAWGGLRTIAGIPVVAALLVLTVAVEVFAYSYQSLLPAVAREILGVGAIGLGSLTFSAGVGSVIGSVALSLIGSLEQRGVLMLGVIFAFGGFLVLFGLSNVYLLSLVLIVGVGAMAAMFDALQWILLQANVPDEMRGRVLGAWMSAIGFGWIGPMTLGAIGQAFGVPWAISGAGSLVVMLGVGTLLFVPQLKRA